MTTDDLTPARAAYHEELRHQLVLALGLNPRTYVRDEELLAIVRFLARRHGPVQPREGRHGR